MPTRLPDPDQTLLTPPDADEVRLLGRGVLSAIRSDGALRPLQGVLVEAVFQAMTGHAVDLESDEIAPDEFARGLAERNEAFRNRIVQVMLLGALVVRPLPIDVADRVEAFARELSVGEGMLDVARHLADGQLGLAAVDFERNGYTSDWSPDRQRALHASNVLDDAWQLSVDDAALAARWAALEDLPDGTLGRRMTEFYRARGFAYPGSPGSAPPLLAQHDWVHLVADYGTTVESELEVFAFIARANDDPHAFSLLAMVVSLFETGYLSAGAGLFEAFPGQLSRDGVATRVADAMRRGALVDGSVDFLGTDWFELAALTVDEVRGHFGVVAKSDDALAAGSVGPWQPGGISAFQEAAGRRAAATAGVDYDAFGAAVASDS
jgi:hypothetical protein